MKKIILIPAYEPDEKLIELLKTINEKKYDIIIVDDGSGEKYQKIFKACSNKAKIISYKQNLGKGHALKTGLKYIKDTYQNNYTIVTMDSDGQHKIEDATKILNKASENPYKLILGMRIRDKKVPLRSKIGNTITKEIYKITTGVKVYDTQTGLRAFTDKLTDFFLSIEGERFEYEMNILLECAKNKIEIEEIPIQTIYIENNKHSHFNTIKDSYLVYKEIIKFSLSSITSFIIDYILFAILSLTTNKIILSNITSRIISSTINYILNKNIVFKNKDSKLTTLTKYILLAITILSLNTVILNILTKQLQINHLIAKIITEIILFILSWLIQKKIIFKIKKEK